MTATVSPAPRQARRLASRRPLALVGAVGLVLVTSLGALAIQSTRVDVTAESPAQGVARVVAQGVAPIGDGEYVWRAVQYTAEPRSQARAVERPLGFVVAGADGPLLLSNDDPDTDEEELEPVARLAPGEVMLVEPGIDQQRASLTDQPVAYVAVEFVPADEAADVGSGQLILQSDPIPVSAGDRDIDCVNALLRDGETTTIPDVGESVVILATDGAIDVIPSGGRRRTLMPGEGDVFTGALEIRPNPDASRAAGTGNGKRVLTGLQAPSGGAVFFAGVLGPEIPPADATEEPTERPIQEVPTVAPAVPTQAPAPTEPPAPTVEERPTETPLPPEPTATETPPVDSDDPDGDGLPTPVERRLQTDPDDFDSDDDRLGDGEEVSFYQTDPLNRDSDGDGLADGEEVFVHATNPLVANTDGDGCGDGEEVQQGFDPLDGQDCPAVE